MKTTEFKEKHRDYTEGQKKDPLTGKVIGRAIEVHKKLGPGLLESSYEKCLVYELSKLGLPLKSQLAMPLRYEEIYIDCGYRIDILVDDYLVIELKSVEQLTNVHRAQILTYMKLAEAPVGLLLNFNVTLLKRGIERFSL